MGKDVAEAFGEARQVFEAVDDALGIGLSDLMWHGPEADLTATHNAQPAILAHTLAVYAAVHDAVEPTAAAGHSLGEYSAYAAADALELVDAARLVRRRGELMLEAGRQRQGTMSAVIGLANDLVVHCCGQASNDDEVVVAANLNAPDQTVISGDPGAVQRAGALCKEAGAKRVLPLKVSGAFHSPLMAPAEAGLRNELADVALGAPRFPVVANASAEPVWQVDAARELLGAQLTSPVQWVGSMVRAAEHAGSEKRFIEVGPGKVLSGLLRRIVPEASSTNLSTADDVRGFLEDAA
jgi:[acyl-carrier-protein] S-malonyltransferase